MILKPDVVKQILGGRRTMIRLPRRTNRCIYREGRAYTLKASQKAPASCRITIVSVSEAVFEDQPVWVVRFVKGDRTDAPRLLAARPGRGDYTTVPALAMKSTGDEVSAATQVTYAKQAAEGLRTARNVLYDEHLARLQAVVSDIREFAVDPRVNENLRGIERQAKSLERKLA